ncbi:5-oxoprolinase subunit PxpB [Bordetella ansorpii]|uniref:5-oxoprolinase subunit PxpB n=1 Tax=Bordetella ansorpii TaxID=288768 RepID=UPI000833CB10|nr:5-oxoprolinase subunit PxpB [Bordetella ansorpii]
MSHAAAPSSGTGSGTPTWRIQAQGDRCVLVRFGEALDVRTGQICLAAANLLRDAGLPGVIDIVPSFTAVAVHYRPSGDGPTFSQLSARIERALAAGIPLDASAGHEIEIPVCYGGEFGPDLPDVAARAGVSTDEVIALHSGPESMVFMLGFAPGHAYIGIHDERLAIPRRPTPRMSIPAGAVAVANRQTVIYPGNLPGGWSVIGATPLVLFDPTREPAALLGPGDRIRFVPISADQYARLRAEISSSSAS